MDALDEGLQGKSYVIPVSKKGEEIKLGNSAYDPVLFCKILDYAKDKTVSLADDIVNGQIDVRPQVIGDRDACEYCAYKGVCGFDAKIPGYEKIKPEEIDAEEFERRCKDGSDVHERPTEGH